MNFIDSFLNTITMYRLVMWGLMLLAVIGIALGFFGFVSYSGISLLGLLVITFATTYLCDLVLGKIFKSAQGTESSYITGLILFFILSPIVEIGDIYFALIASVAASLSKYIFAIGKRHLFNPAAMGAFIGSLFGGFVLWWVATPYMLPFVLILGLLIVRKIRRFDLFLPFLIIATGTHLIVAASFGESASASVTEFFLSWPVIFFGTVMLTEPYTTPPTRNLRIAYGVLVGALFSLQFKIGPLHTSPHFVLLLGNIFAYLVSSKQRMVLTLLEQLSLSSSVQEFVFKSHPKPVFVPGQYMEWTLPHKKPDLRGNRRYFTIASAPEDSEVRLAVRIGEHSSSYKHALRALKRGDTLTSANIAGEFVMPKDTTQPLLFIAGGVGVTPYVSFMRHMIRTGEKRDAVLIYSVNTLDEAAFKELIEQAKGVGVRTIILAGAHITPQWLSAEVPDYKKRHFYLSGPQGMVSAYKKLARSLGIAHGNIHTDYFPGL